MAKRARTKKICYVCQGLSYVDRHHIRPVEYGGDEKGRTVDLCANCHRNVHEDAESRFEGLLPPYPHNFDFGNRLALEDRSVEQRLAVLSLYIFNMKRQHEESGKLKADTARNMLQISLSVDELAIAHDLKRKYGFKSLNRLVKHLLVTEWKQRNLNRS